jgi:hypothetical protein
MDLRRARSVSIGIVGAVTLAMSAASAATAAKRYTVPVVPDYETRALFTVGDQVPWLEDPERAYQMVGIPDGLGAHSNDDVEPAEDQWGEDSATLYMNHEFGNSIVTEPLIGGPRFRGAYVSQWILDEDGDPIAGDRAYDDVFNRDTFVGPAAQDDNTTPAFGRLCSGTLAGPREGLDRYIYFAGEETAPSVSFDSSKGGSAVAFFDNEAHVLPDLGHMSWENAVIKRNTGNRTVIMSMEDGPATLDNQLWMYVGTKNRRSESVLERNGLVGGNLYFFRSNDSSRNSEATFEEGSVTGQWVEISGGGDQPEAALESQADANNAMTFIRPEDGAFNQKNSNEFFWVTTGGNDTVNRLGRLYELDLGSGDPSSRPATLTVVYNADLITAEGQDIAVSPDNIGTSGDYLMINEDGTTQSREWMASRNRDGSIWRFEIGRGTPSIDWEDGERIAELDPPGEYDPTPIGPGVWETSGIIDASNVLSSNGDDDEIRDLWLFDVQAHQSNPQNRTQQNEDGQLMLLWGLDNNDEDD